MRKPLYNMVFAVLIATPFLALGSFVNSVTPLHATVPNASIHSAIPKDLKVVDTAHAAMGHLEQARWLQLTPLTAGQSTAKVVHAVRTWSL